MGFSLLSLLLVFASLMQINLFWSMTPILRLCLLEEHLPRHAKNLPQMDDLSCAPGAARKVDTAFRYIGKARALNPRKLAHHGAGTSTCAEGV